MADFSVNSAVFVSTTVADMRCGVSGGVDNDNAGPLLGGAVSTATRSG